MLKRLLHFLLLLASFQLVFGQETQQDRFKIAIDETTASGKAFSEAIEEDRSLIGIWEEMDNAGLRALNIGLVNAWKKMGDLGAAEALRKNQKALDALAKKDAGEIVPDPDTYLDADYISNHLEKFDEGASFLVPKSALDRFGRDPVGRPDGQFTLPKPELDELLRRANGDLSIVEEKLGIPSGLWNGLEILRVDIPNPKKFNIRLPSGNEGGANELWIPGGKTSGGIPEAVVDPIPLRSYIETPTQLK